MKQIGKPQFGGRKALAVILLVATAALSGCSLGNTPQNPSTSKSFQTREETPGMNTNRTAELTSARQDTQNDEFRDRGYVVVTDTVKTGKYNDCTKALQELIDKNPKRTIYFPDGLYVISEPIRTSADPEKAVSLLLSDFAIIRADSARWSSDEAMIRLGAIDSNKNSTVNYSLSGGVIDGSGVAKAISIDGGRETKVQNVSVKSAQIGLHIKKGVNNGSSDADIFNVNISGNGKPDSVGMLIEGYDNTITNSRIVGVQVGVHLKSGANMLRNIHPLYYAATAELYSRNYPTSYAFWDENGTNWYDYCYSDHFRVAFCLGKNKNGDDAHSFFRNCFAFWYDDGGLGVGYTATAFLCEGKFESSVSDFKAAFRSDRPACMLQVGAEGGKGRMESLWILNSEKLIPADCHKTYLKD